MKEKNNKNYGLFTTISMIIGIVIGSGIIFKSTHVLKATNGNVLLGVLVFMVASIAIIFGGLTLGQLALRSSGDGGIISYAKEGYGKKASGVFGWFFSMVYYPTITAVLAWVSSVYFYMFLNISASLEMQIILAVLILFVLIGLNVFSAKASGYFQNFAAFVKLLPLLLIAIIGFFLTPASLDSISYTPSSTGTSFLMFFTAVGPISFIFDGWTVSTSISGEIKNPKRILPLALTISPIIILAFYLLYFIGITRVMDVSEIISLGNDYIYVLSTRLFGPIGSKILIFVLVISMLGTTNGLLLGFSRSVNHLANEDLFILSSKIKSPLDRLPIKGIFVSGLFTVFWLAIHYLTMKFKLLGNSDISEISIATMYLLLIFLYLKVISLKKQGMIKGWVRGVLFPILAILGSIVLFSGSLQNKYFILYFGFSILVLLSSYLYLRKKSI